MKADSEDDVSIDVSLYFPPQESIDAGDEPALRIEIEDGVFGFVDVYRLFSEEVTSFDNPYESADVVAEWLEHWAVELRKQFPGAK